MPWIGKGILWKVGNGSDIRLGVDPVVGLGNSFILPHDLRLYLEYYGISTLDQVRNKTSFAADYWFTTEELDLCGEWKFLWEKYIRGLEYNRIRLNALNDSLLWSHSNYVGPITAAKGYDCISASSNSEDRNSVIDSLWILISLQKLHVSFGCSIKVKFSLGSSCNPVGSKVRADVFCVRKI